MQEKRIRTRLHYLGYKSSHKPYLFSVNGKWRKQSTAVAPGKAYQATNYKRRLSSTTALLPSANKLKLQELAKDELLASLNEPLHKNTQEHERVEEERDEVDYAVSEVQDELVQLTELKRVKVIEEIYETEKKYISCLDTVDKVFREPMLDGGVAQEKDVSALFPSCLSIIRECHVWFMDQLENRIKCEDWQGSIGDILGKMAGPLKDNLLNVYTDYVNAFPKSISTFSKCTRTSQKFRRFIEDCYGKSDNLDLPSYLITPVQRLPRYVLLLRQLSKYTRDDHPDNDSIKTALIQMEELILSLNGSIQSSMNIYTARESENRKSIRRQLSRRRKKPRPVSLQVKEEKLSDDKSNRLGSPNHLEDNAVSSSPIGIPRVVEENEDSPQKNQDKIDAENTVPPSDEKNRSLASPSHILRPITPDYLRKSKSENRKSLRRSIGAALSSFWSPKDMHEKFDEHSHATEVDVDRVDDAGSKANMSRRKYGVSYTPAAVADLHPSPSAPIDIDVKQRRFSSSFREKTRNFKVQMRRRSGTWFSTTEEEKLSTNSDLPSRSSLNSVNRCSAVLEEDSKPRTGSKASTLMSMFSKRKSKHSTDTNATQRRRSDSDRDVQSNDDSPHRTLSLSVSAPSFQNKRKESKTLSINSSIHEESYDSDLDKCANLSLGESVNNNCMSTGNGQLHTSSVINEVTNSNVNEKKHKRGKIMKTLRHMMGKGKS